MNSSSYVASVQSAVRVAVLSTGIYYEWTPDPVALSIVAAGAAWLATKMMSALLSLREVCCVARP